MSRCYGAHVFEECKEETFRAANMRLAVLPLFFGIDAALAGRTEEALSYWHRISDEMLFAWGKKFGIAMIALAAKKKAYRPLASLLPDDFLNGLYEYLRSSRPNRDVKELWGDEGMKIFLASFKSAETGAAVHDWFLFQEEFLVQGNPRAVLEKTRGSAWSHALEGIVALAEEHGARRL